MTFTQPRWELRTTADELAARYRAADLWNDESLGEYLGECMLARPELRFRIWSAQRQHESTFGDMHLLARRVAAGFAARGIGPGDVVSFQMPNCVEAAATFWGLSLLGATIVPIVHFYAAKEVRFILEESGARSHCMVDRFGSRDYLETLDAIGPAVDRLEDVFVVGDVPSGCVPFSELTTSEPIDRPNAVDPDWPAFVSYTSGTTSNPKGVVHSHRSAVAEIRSKLGFRVLPRGAPPMLIGAPVSHAIGMLGALLMPLAWENEVHLTDVWDPPAVLAAMLEGGLTAGSGATYFLTSLLDDAAFTDAHLALMPYVILGGSTVPPAIAERADALGISIVRGYGSTEHPTTTGCLHGDPRAKRLYTDGRVLPGVQIRTVDDSGADVEPGKPGEVLSRGPDLFVGYTDSSLTEEAIDPDGWYATGDVGVIDEDGYLTIVDRKKDIIIRGGENVSSVEVEECLMRMDGVAEVAVVPAPDARLGERGCAFVRVRDGCEPPDLESVQDHFARAGIAKQKWPEEIRVVDDYPRTASGKIKKYVLRRKLWDGVRDRS